MGNSRIQRIIILASSVLAIAAFNNEAMATKHRSHSAIAEFKRISPCPSTGKQSGSCPGHIIDHIEPLCAGGLDAPSNMQWQAVDEAKEKDKGERARCAAMRKAGTTRN